MEVSSNDSRFSHVYTDPRFRIPHTKATKVKIDSRFKSLFTDKDFIQKCSVDKRGRPIPSSSTENLKRLYDYEDDSSGCSDGDIGEGYVEEDEN